MEIFIKTSVSEKPESPYQFGEKLTRHQEGRLVGYREGYEAALALFKPIQAEAISLEEAKEQIAKKYDAPSWTRLIGSCWNQKVHFDKTRFEEFCNKAAELYMQQNTAALRKIVDAAQHWKAM